MILIEKKVRFYVPDDLPDDEVDRLAGAVEDEIDMGLAAVGRNVVEKYGNGKITFKVED